MFNFAYHSLVQYLVLIIGFAICIANAGSYRPNPWKMFAWNEKKDQCNKIGYFRDEKDCRKFYRCYEMGSQLVRANFTCAPDHKNQPTAFNEDISGIIYVQYEEWT